MELYTQGSKEEYYQFSDFRQKNKYMGKKWEKGREVRWEKGIAHINVGPNNFLIHFK